MTLFTPMRALTVVIECCLDALATILDPGPGVPDEYLRAAVGAEQLADAEAEEDGWEAPWVGPVAFVAYPSDDEITYVGLGAGHGGSGGCAATGGSGGSVRFHKLTNAEWAEAMKNSGPLLVLPEPPFAEAEIVAIRQLLEERSNFITTPCADRAAGDPGPAAQDGPAPGNSTGMVTPGAGHLSRDDLMDAARAVRWAAESHPFTTGSMAGAWYTLAARLEDAAASTPN